MRFTACIALLLIASCGVEIPYDPDKQPFYCRENLCENECVTEWGCKGDPANVCTPLAFVDLDDGVPCTIDVCDKHTGEITHHQGPNCGGNGQGGEGGEGARGQGGDANGGGIPIGGSEG